MSNKRALWETFLSLPGPKLTIWDRRIHHGAVGALLIPVGIFLALHDWRDRSDWFRGRWT